MFEVIIHPSDTGYTRLNYKGRTTWKTKAAADNRAKQWKGENLRDAWAQPLPCTIAPHYPISGDRRYTIATEYCGESTARYVLRFCGEFVAQSISPSSMTMRAVGHKAALNGAAIITEQRSN